MHFQPDDMAGVLELDTTEDLGNESDAPVNTVDPVKLGGNVMWSDPVMTEPTRNMVTRLG